MLFQQSDVLDFIDFDFQMDVSKRLTSFGYYFDVPLKYPDVYAHRKPKKDWLYFNGLKEI